MITKLKEGIHWVGYLDWPVRDFHSFDARRGVTYNAYLVQDEQLALIDTVKEPHFETLLGNIAELADPAKIRYVVCNHAEPDHSSALPMVLPQLPDAVVVCNKKCQATLADHYDVADWKFQIVKSGDTISLGRRTLQFFDTPMVHWPESMFTYVPEEKLLFSMDTFGQHYATSQRFDDEVPLCTAMEEAKTYYANIIMPYGKQAGNALKQAQGLDIEMIAPSHGLIWRSHVRTILDAYENWVQCKPKPKVLVVYDSMWGATERMAVAIHEGATQPGVEVELIPIRKSNLTQLATEMVDAPVVAFGSSTLNQGLMPMLGAVFTYLKGLRPPGKAGMAFGSYGWTKGGPEAAHAALEEMQWEILQAPLSVRYRPGEEVLDACREAGRMLAAKAIEKAGGRTSGGKTCVDP